MKVEQPPHQRNHRWRAAAAAWLLIAAGCLGLLGLSCSSGSDGGPASGGSTSASGGEASAGTASGGASVGGSSGQAVDCTALCGHVKSLCSENSAISDVWIDACKSACDARVQLTPNVAELERTCVTEAADCSAATLCVASPH